MNDTINSVNINDINKPSFIKHDLQKTIYKTRFKNRVHLNRIIIRSKTINLNHKHSIEKQNTDPIVKQQTQTDEQNAHISPIFYIVFSHPHY